MDNSESLFINKLENSVTMFEKDDNINGTTDNDELEIKSAISHLHVSNKELSNIEYLLKNSIENANVQHITQFSKSVNNLQKQHKKNIDRLQKLKSKENISQEILEEINNQLKLQEDFVEEINQLLEIAQDAIKNPEKYKKNYNFADKQTEKPASNEIDKHFVPQNDIKKSEPKNPIEKDTEISAYTKVELNIEIDDSISENSRNGISASKPTQSIDISSINIKKITSTFQKNDEQKPQGSKTTQKYGIFETKNTTQTETKSPIKDTNIVAPQVKDVYDIVQEDINTTKLIEFHIEDIDKD